MGMSDGTSIAEIIGFLSDFAPDALGQLRGRYSGSEAVTMLTKGSALGAADRSDGAGDPSVALGLKRIKCEAALAALDLAAKMLPTLVVHLVRRSKRANIWETLGSLLAIVGSGTALTILWPEVPNNQRAQWAAALALVGSVAAFAPKALRKPFVGTAENVNKLLVEAQDVLVRIDQLRPVLRHAVDTPAALDLQEVQEAIEVAETLVRRARQLPLEAQ